MLESPSSAPMSRRAFLTGLLALPAVASAAPDAAPRETADVTATAERYWAFERALLEPISYRIPEPRRLVASKLVEAISRANAIALGSRAVTHFDARDHADAAAQYAKTSRMIEHDGEQQYEQFRELVPELPAYSPRALIELYARTLPALLAQEGMYAVPVLENRAARSDEETHLGLALFMNCYRIEQIHTEIPHALRGTVRAVLTVSEPPEETRGSLVPFAQDAWDHYRVLAEVGEMPAQSREDSVLAEHMDEIRALLPRARELSLLADDPVDTAGIYAALEIYVANPALPAPPSLDDRILEAANSIQARNAVLEQCADPRRNASARSFRVQRDTYRGMKRRAEHLSWMLQPNGERASLYAVAGMMRAPATYDQIVDAAAARAAVCAIAGIALDAPAEVAVDALLALPSLTPEAIRARATTALAAPDMDAVRAYVEQAVARLTPRSAAAPAPRDPYARLRAVQRFAAPVIDATRARILPFLAVSGGIYAALSVLHRRKLRIARAAVFASLEAHIPQYPKIAGTLDVLRKRRTQPSAPNAREDALRTLSAIALRDVAIATLVDQLYATLPTSEQRFLDSLTTQ